MSAATTLSPRRRPVAYRFLGDERLGRLAGKGDAAAFAVIFERHHQAVYRYSRSIVRDPDDASDVLQSTMVKALRALPEQEGDVNVRAWLFRVAHNEAVSVLRRRRPQAELTEGDAGGSQSPEEHAATRERLDELLADLAALPERQRGALVMRELSGLSYAEVAEALESTEAAAKQAVYEARTALVDNAEGRDAMCEDVRRSLSSGDRRVLRGRKVRAHLRACEACRDFQAAVETRRRELGALVPALSPVAAAGVLDKAMASAGLGSGGTGGGILGFAGGGGELLGGGALKAVAVAAVAVTGAGAGAVGVARALDERERDRPAPPARTESAIVPIGGADTTPRSLVTERLDPEADGFGDRPAAKDERERKTTSVADTDVTGEDAEVAETADEEGAEARVPGPDADASTGTAPGGADIAGNIGTGSGSDASPSAARPVLADVAPVRERVRDTAGRLQQDAREIRDRLDALPVPASPPPALPEVPVPVPATPDLPVAEVPVTGPIG